VSVNGKHGVIGGGHVEWADVDGIIAASGKEAVPLIGGGGDIKDEPLYTLPSIKAKEVLEGGKGSLKAGLPETRELVKPPA
jgi:hypothetical protein